MSTPNPLREAKSRPGRASIATAWLLAASSLAAQPERIVTDELGRLPAFSHATRLGDVIFVSGTLGTLGAGLDLVGAGMGEQTTQTLRNIETILQASGSTLNHVAKCNVFVTDMAAFGEMNAAYLEVFGPSPPARTTVEVTELALGAVVEIECIAQRAPQALRSDITQSVGTLEHEGEQIYYEVTGEGEAVVLSHGAGGNHAIWFQQVPTLASHYQVITWDQRSFGRSSDRAGEASPESFRRDLEALLDHLGVERAHLVGQSMGGWTTIGFALENPERVLSIVLADTVGGLITPEVREDLTRLAQSGLELPGSIFEHRALGRSTLDRRPELAFLYRQIGSAGLQRNPAIAERLFALDWAPRAAEIQVPTLLVVGSEDDLFTPRSIRSVANLIDGARVAEIPAAGHSPYFETPDTWNRIVLEFLDAVE